MNTIIIYYSYSNHTRMIAQKLKEELNFDILEIQPKVPYSSDYQKVVDLTEDNLETKKTPEIEDININLDNYGKVILGTPVWWYTITPPIRTFLTKYDLSNKTVIPFATNAGWLGSTFEEIKEICKGNIVDEISIQFTTNHEDDKLITSNKEIEDWIKRIRKD